MTSMTSLRMTNIALHLTILLALAGGALHSLPALAQSPGEQLHALFAEEWDWRMESNPLMATFAGNRNYEDRLPDVSPAAQAARLEASRNFLERLHGLNRDALSAEDQLNYDLFEFVLHHRIRQLEFRDWRMPFVSDSGFHTNITRVAQNMAFRTADDYENYLSRLEALPAYFGQHIENMRIGIEEDFTMPRIIMDGVADQAAAEIVDDPQDSPFYAPFQSYPEHFSVDLRQDLDARADAAMDGVIGAYEALHEFFTDEYIPAARESIGAIEWPEGEDYYRYLVTFYTTVDITPEEVHAIGLAEVERIRAEMEAIIEEVGFDGTFQEFLDFLRTDPQFYAETPEELLKEASFLAKKIDGQLPSLFGKLPRQPYGVEPVPDAIAPTYTTGRYVGAPLDAKRGGTYWVNTYALDKRPLYALPSLTLHEAAPGHHLQSALSKELENVPPFRQSLYPHAFGEGWGLYSEKLGLELGLYEDPYDNFGRLTYEMWRAGRLVVDTGMHFMGWTREEAVQFFEENSALSTHNINTEVNRYISWPGQALAYKMGELMILELRNRAEEALGENFDIRDFHDEVLSAGGVPLSILEDRIDAWIAEQQQD